MLKIHSVNRDGNRYCGPAVISALTQCTTDEAARLIRSVNGKRSVKGTSYGDMFAALALCGIRAARLQSLPLKLAPTLAGWLALTEKMRTPGRVFLLVAGNHWQLVHSDTYVCGIVRDVVEVTHNKVKRRARVTLVWELTAQTVSIPTAARAAPAQRTDDKARRELRKLCKVYGIEIERARSDFERIHFQGWIYPPAELPDEQDPLDDDHYFVGVDEALDKARQLVEAIKNNQKKC